MIINKPKVALIYDFDKTLSPKDMHDFSFVEKTGLGTEEFWNYCDTFYRQNSADRILSYMYAMLKLCKQKNLPLTKQLLNECGKKIQLFNGVDTWFNRINKYGEQIGVEVEHYIISSGLKDMIEGTEIAKYFKEIYAGYYIYENDIAVWPALAINYTNKTQFLYRINKGILGVTDESLNDNMSHDLRPVPFTNMIYIGDSATDIPCMRLVMKNGGYSIGVYQDNQKHKEYLSKLIANNKINYVVPADYSENTPMDIVVKEILSSIKHNANLKNLTKMQKKKLM